MKKNKKKPTKHRYNWKPDLPDFRDYTFTERFMAKPTLPKQIDLRPLCPPIVDQGRIGSCTANALSGALGFLELQELKTKGQDPEEFGPDFEPFSRLFIYYNERAAEGHTDQDAGASLRDGIKTLAANGACRESVWKYSPAQVFKKPLAKAYKEAAEHTITSYLKLSTLAEMKQCLASGFPFVFGFMVYESFESATVAKTGLMPIPSEDEKPVGGHAVLAVGYDDSSQQLIVRNSWGTKWGDQGYFRMSYAVIDELKLARDFWVVKR